MTQNMNIELNLMEAVILNGTFSKQGEPGKFKFVFSACLREKYIGYNIFEQIEAIRPDFVALLGDQMYGDYDGNLNKLESYLSDDSLRKALSKEGEIILNDKSVLEAFRNKYSRVFKENFQKMASGIPLLATWDDHDYGENDAGASYSKRLESQRIFADFWKLPRQAAPRQRPGVYDAHVYGPKGQRTQVILLDTRYFRGPLKRGEKRVGGPYYPTTDPTITMLGEDQWKWLEQQLRVPAEIRIIATSIQYIAESAGQETWSNIPLERARLLKLIKQTKANGILMISGDRHWAEIASLPGPTGYPLYDITSSSLNQPHGRGTPTINQYRDVPETYHQVNFGTILVDWQQSDPTIQLQILDLEGQPRIQKKLKLSNLRSGD